MKSHFFVCQGHSLFIPLKYFYPEAVLLCDKHNEIHPMACFTHPSVMNSTLVEPIVRRARFMFDVLWEKLMKVVPKERQLFVYFTYKNRPNSIQMLYLKNDMASPRVLIANRSAFDKVKSQSKTYEWDQPLDFTMLGSSKELINVQS